MNLARITYFLHNEIWQDSEHEKSGNRLTGWLKDCLKTVYLAIRFFIERRHTDYATALSFSTILAIVPVAAVVFAVARGFGLDAFIEQWLHDALAAQPEVADYIIRLAGSYLEHARSGVIIGIGLLFMLYSVLSLIYNIEHAFDEIWQVKDNRSATRIVTDYTALLFLVPVVIIVISGVNIFIYGIVDRLQAFMVLGSLAKAVIKLLPFVMMSCLFTGLFVFMPNTKVRFSKAVIPGTIAGIAMLLLQFFYIHCQVFLTSYNAIYGSFAALPLFMLWIMISWYICLFCAELCYMNQNREYYAFLAQTDDTSHEQQMTMAVMLMSVIAQRFSEGKPPYTALQLKEKTGIPIRIATDMLHRLRDARLLNESLMPQNDNEPAYQPAQDLQKITVGRIVERLERCPSGSRKRISLSTAHTIDSETWSRLKSFRARYIDTLNEISISDVTIR